MYTHTHTHTHTRVYTRAYPQACRRGPGNGLATVFLRNLSFDTTEAELKTTFEKFGKVRFAKLVLDKITERPRGSGFVQAKLEYLNKDWLYAGTYIYIYSWLCAGKIRCVYLDIYDMISSRYHHDIILISRYTYEYLKMQFSVSAAPRRRPRHRCVRRPQQRAARQSW